MHGGRTARNAGPAVSVIIPFQADTARLRECLAHLERQTFRAFDVYLVSDAGSTFAGAGVHEIVAGAVLPNRKRQLAAETSAAPIVAFIDDDAYPAPDWLAAALPHFADPNVVACGGPAVTPDGDSDEQRASGAVFAAKIVTAGTRHRYVAEAQRDVDALPACNLLIRRDVFLRDADASSRFWPGEDILACIFATRNGERIVYDPAVLVYHHRRALFGPHLRQVWAYGRFRGYFLRRHDHSWRNAVYAAPALFVLAHAVVVPLAINRSGRSAALGAAGTYFVLVAVSAVREARRARTHPMRVAAGIYLTHLTYGLATIAGWLREPALYEPASPRKTLRR